MVTDSVVVTRSEAVAPAMAKLTGYGVSDGKQLWSVTPQAPASYVSPMCTYNIAGQGFAVDCSGTIPATGLGNDKTVDTVQFFNAGTGKAVGKPVTVPFGLQFGKETPLIVGTDNTTSSSALLIGGALYSVDRQGVLQSANQTVNGWSVSEDDSVSYAPLNAHVDAYGLSNVSTNAKQQVTADLAVRSFSFSAQGSKSYVQVINTRTRKAIGPGTRCNSTLGGLNPAGSGGSTYATSPNGRRLVIDTDAVVDLDTGRVRCLDNFANGATVSAVSAVADDGSVFASANRPFYLKAGSTTPIVYPDPSTPSPVELFPSVALFSTPNGLVAVKH